MKTSLPEVAIISVFYNRESYVKESVESLLNQTYKNLQIILVDDSSTDSTYEKLVEFKTKDNRVSTIRNETNKGFTQTLIDTINNLNVKYIAIHGSGDISMPTRVDEQVNYLEQNPDVGVVTVDITNIKKQKFHQKEITLKHLLGKNRVTHGAVMFRLDAYNKAGGYRPFFSSRQDKDLWFRMSLVTKIHFYNKKLYKQVRILDSVSRKTESAKIPTLLSVFSTYLIKERLKFGIDSLDLYGCQAGLAFKPSKCNWLLIKLIRVELFNLNLTGTIDYLKLFKEFNSNIFILFFVNTLIMALKAISKTRF